MTIHYSTETRISGPWLLDSEALIQLDQVVNEVWTRLENQREQLISQDAEERFQRAQALGLHQKVSANERKKKVNEYKKDASYNLRRSSKDITIFLKNGGTYKTDDLSLALRDNALLNEIATGLSVDLESGDVRCRLSISKRFNELQLDISPEQIPEARESFVTLRQWAIKNSAPTWQRVWGQIAGYQWMAWFVMLMIVFFTLEILSSNRTADAEQRARALLNQGITEQNSVEAIELLLILQTKYDPKSSNFTIPSWMGIVVLVGLLICIALSFRPKVLLGIGKGDSQISHWRAWHRIVGITIPGLIFASFIWPIIVELIKGWFK